jgi:peptidoglycan/LPS O-acetylase OafA/YrhL
MASREYRSDIDGLRAIAVVAVILFHANLGLSGGYVGVDVFFVISGYLITTLILQELEAGSFTIAGFWERRIRRIFPASALVMACTLAAGVALLFPTELIDLVKQAMAQLMLASNVWFWRTSGYFDAPAEVKPLLHTWSLAVEEQFYLVYPFLLMACGRLPRRWLQLVLGGMLMASFALCVWGTNMRPAAAFYLLPTRAWELLVGALLATGRRESRFPRSILESLSWIGLGCIVFAFWRFGPSTPFPGVAAILPCLGTALVVWSNTSRRTVLGCLLSLRPIVFIGLISYSLYLLHWPILVFIRYCVRDTPPFSIRIAGILASMLLACLSWRFVETPIRKRRDGASRQAIFATALASTSLLFGATAFIWQAGGLPGRFPPEVLRFVEGKELPLHHLTPQVEKISHDELPVLGWAAAEEPIFLLWGDSHALPVAAALDEVATKHKFRGVVAAKEAVPPVLECWRASAGREAVDWNREVLEFVRRKHIPNVILVSDWEVSINGRENGSLDTLLIDDKNPIVSRENAREVLRTGLTRTIEALQQAGADVWIMRQVPIQQRTPVEIALGAWRQNQALPQHGVSRAEHLRRQANVDRILTKQRLGAVHILEVEAGCFDSSGYSLISESGRSYYLDKSHLSGFGGRRLLGPVFESALKQMAAALNRTEYVRTKFGSLNPN